MPVERVSPSPLSFCRRWLAWKKYGVKWLFSFAYPYRPRLLGETTSDPPTPPTPPPLTSRFCFVSLLFFRVWELAFFFFFFRDGRGLLGTAKQ